MKLISTISEITHDDLVDLLSTASYGSEWLGLRYSPKEYKELDNAKEDDCLEDKCAKLLLAGKTITLQDYYAEDSSEFYDSPLPHTYREGRFMSYTVSLDDIKRVIEKMLCEGGWHQECVTNFVYNRHNFDLPQAECIIQLVLWGEEIYG